MLGSIVRVGALLAAPLRLATPSVARCLSMTAPSLTSAAASAASTAPAVSTVDAGAERSNAVNASVDAKVASIFYEPSVKVSKRQRQVFASLADEPPLPLMEDHGFLYRTQEAELSGANDLVKRALSTRTGNIQQVLAFRRSEILRKFSAKQFDTGASRVQVAMLTERINRLAAHSSRNSHDKNCKRSLTALTVRRRKLLEYMMSKDYQNYRLMIRELNLRPLPLFNSRHLPKVREETHKQVKERHARLKNRVSRGHKGH